MALAGGGRMAAGYACLVPVDGDRANACSVSPALPSAATLSGTCRLRAEEARVATCRGLRSMRQFRPVSRPAGTPVRSSRSCVKRSVRAAAFASAVKTLVRRGRGPRRRGAPGRRLGPALVPGLLVVHHTPPPALQAMFEAAVSGARADQIRGRRGGPAAGPDRGGGRCASGRRLPARHPGRYRLHVRRAEALLRRHLLSVPGSHPAPALRPVRARQPGHLAARYARPVSITAGLQWRGVRPPACVTGAPGKQDLQACWELGALPAAEIAG